jgi:hypothetical protein
MKLQLTVVAGQVWADIINEDNDEIVSLPIYKLGYQGLIDLAFLVDAGEVEAVIAFWRKVG